MHIRFILTFLILALIAHATFCTIASERRRRLTFLPKAQEGFQVDKLPSHIAVQRDPPEIQPYICKGCETGKNKAGSEIETTKQTHKLNLRIMDVCVKASFQSCFDGVDVSTEMLEYVISRGCRVLDFEVFNIDGTARVGFSERAVGKGIIPANKASAKVTLDAALSKAVECGFSNSGCPNPNDPLFIHVRIRADPSDLAFLTTIARCVESNLAGKLVKKKLAPDTSTMKEIMDSVVFMLDVSGAPKYAQTSLVSYVNIETGNSSAMLINSNSLIRTKNATHPHGQDGMRSTVTRLILTTPEDTYLSEWWWWVYTADYESVLLKKYGVQMDLFPYYSKSAENVRTRETFFKTANAAIVPLSSVL